jgi:hypothetical protein
MAILVVIGLGMVTALRQEIVPGANTKTKTAIRRKKNCKIINIKFNTMPVQRLFQSELSI